MARFYSGVDTGVLELAKQLEIGLLHALLRMLVGSRAQFSSFTDCPAF
jgi:hypothetical protein